MLLKRSVRSHCV